MRMILALALLGMAHAASAQVLVNQQTASDSAVAEIRAAMPPTCETPPAPDAVVATAGVAPPCTPRSDAARQTQIPPASATTTADGSFSGSWTGGVTLPTTPTRGIATIYGTVVPYHCQLATMSTTGFTGKCWALVTTTLPAVPTALLGLAVSPVANPAAGLTVNIFARY